MTSWTDINFRTISHVNSFITLAFFSCLYMQKITIKTCDINFTITIIFHDAT